MFQFVCYYEKLVRIKVDGFSGKNSGVTRVKEHTLKVNIHDAMETV